MTATRRSARISMKAIGYNDTTVEFEITSNRPDCLSVIGLARETAATFGTELKVRSLSSRALTGISTICSR